MWGRRQQIKNLTMIGSPTFNITLCFTASSFLLLHETFHYLCGLFVFVYSYFELSSHDSYHEHTPTPTHQRTWKRIFELCGKHSVEKIRWTTTQLQMSKKNKVQGRGRVRKAEGIKTRSHNAQRAPNLSHSECQDEHNDTGFVMWSNKQKWHIAKYHKLI